MGIDRQELQAARWSPEKAAACAEQCRRVRGCNYIPRNSVTFIQMWNDLNVELIDQELGWGAQIGLNSVRVFVPDLLYEQNPERLLDTVARFIDLCGQHHLSVMPVLAVGSTRQGTGVDLSQPIDTAYIRVKPGVHPQRWHVPGSRARTEAEWPEIEHYTKRLLQRFAHDERIIAWDLFNEARPPYRGLVEMLFAWAREVNPAQPLTACWQADDLSDIITFHTYADPRGGPFPWELAPELVTADPPSAGFAEELRVALSWGRPTLCTETMARTFGSTLPRILPRFYAAKVGWYVWGLVTGATQTRYPWHWPEGAPEPRVWFHDLLYPDGTPYNEDEIELIRAYADID